MQPEHYQFIETAAHNKLPATKLERLGQINVICGKNNSGKSTLLQALSNPSSNPALVVTDEVRDALYMLRDKTPLQGSDTSAKVFFEQGINDCLDGQSVWYRSDQELFITRFQHWHRNTNLRPEFQFDAIIVTGYFTSLFPVMNSVLIPCPRNPEHRGGYSFVERVDPIGAGLASYLFYARNRQLDDQDARLFVQIKNAFQHITHGFEL